VHDGVAILPIDGVIAKRMNMFTQISGGTSTQLAAQALQQAINDPAVHSIVLSIDSPGGTVDGTQALANAVLKARDSGKAIVTLGDGCMCSAAYWIGSAAQAVYIADSTTQVGSIGVVASHIDVSGAQASQGVKTTEISAGKYKRIASQYGPLTKDGRQSIQDNLDYTYSLFVNAVAKNRNVSGATVLANMADGRVFTGKQAIDAGLVDGIETLDSLISRLNTNRKTGGGVQPVKPAPRTRVEIDQDAKAFMKSNPGMDYVTAFKRVTQTA
jgi:signal peptide peptidase SppA